MINYSQFMSFFKPAITAIIAISIVISITGIALTTGINTINIGGDTQGLNGQTKNIIVEVSGMSAVGSLQLDVMYDPAVVTANSVTFGSVTTGGLTASNINKTSGKVTIGIISSTGISGTGNLATISITVVGIAGDTTNLHLIKKNLKDFNVLPVNTEPNITDGTFSVIGLPCTITAPADITTEATGPTTIVNLGTSITSNCGNSIVSNNAPAGGFPVGNTTVIWTVSKNNQVRASDTQLVTIIPQSIQLSIVAPADIIDLSTGSLTTIANLGTPTVTGGTQPYYIVNDAPPGGFPAGTTTVTWTVDNGTGTASDTQLIKIKEIVVIPSPPVPELSPGILNEV